ncbi:MAG: fibrobacter succinogenes major paralogous domain-containing protein [Fibromonadaceae bacterium]|jgi:uncharacterized protein (TIGR02145 family)|nr:fibrobacter succinogenes major paralogous domain-containing protein [Fibromonadaceae bacterium]
MRFVPLLILLFFALAANAAPPAKVSKAAGAPAAIATPVPVDSPTQEQKRVAILNTLDNGEPSLDFTDLTYLTDKLREIALKTLPQDKYFVMTTESIIDKLGSKDNARKVCKEAQCMAEIGRKISADYIGQARLGRFGGNFTISMELYHCARGNLIGSFTEKAKDVLGLEAIIKENAPMMFGGMPDAKAHPAAATTVAPATVATQAPDSVISSFKDSRDGRTYKVIKIGKQTWMAENLNYNENGSKCYDNKIEYCEKYGRLYNWVTAKAVCPKGWHLPSLKEWEAFGAVIGSGSKGKRLKTTSGWSTSNNGTDDYGFSALPGGYGHGDNFNHIGDESNWWSSSNLDVKFAIRTQIFSGEFDFDDFDKNFLLSVRCLKD